MSEQLVQCEFVCDGVRSCSVQLTSGEFRWTSADGVLRLPSGRELRRPMPLRKGLSLAPGVYRVQAYIGPIFRIVSAEAVTARL